MAAALEWEPVEVDDGSDRVAWLEARRTGISASDAPAILGISPFSNPFELAAVKRGLVDSDRGDSELLKWGHIVEQPMLEMFLEETGLTGGLTKSLFRTPDPDEQFMLATPDGWVREDDEIGGIECKLKMFHAKEWERDGIPDHVITQTQHQMRVMGWNFVYVLALLDGYRLRFHRVERNDDVMGSVVMPAEHAWWQAFQADEPMDPTAGDPRWTNETLRRLYPEDSGETIRLNGIEWLQTVERMATAKENEKRWKREADTAAAKLKAAIGANSFAVLDDGTELSLKTTRRKESISKATSFRSLRTVASK